MQSPLLRIGLLTLALARFSLVPVDAADKPAPIRALVITGGCCHNYVFQTLALTEAISSEVEVRWTIVNEGGKGTEAMIPLYEKKDWAKDFDVVIHNECFANTDNPEYIRKITAAHKQGVPAIVIHCAMHTYRKAEIDDWRTLLGVTSKRHDHQSEYPVVVKDPKHPIMKGFPEAWVTPKDELYIIEKLWPTAKALAVSKSEKDGSEHPVFWTNEFGKAKVFGTTYGHSDDTFRDPVFLRTLTRGLLWVTGRL